jgi:hypothetical protein
VIFPAISTPGLVSRLTLAPENARFGNLNAVYGLLAAGSVEIQTPSLRMATGFNEVDVLLDPEFVFVP